METSENNVVIITGAGGGIGKASAKRFLKMGWAVIIAECDSEAGREAEAEYAQLGPVKFIETDVADESSVQEMVAEAVKEFGRIDGLVNNAGISDPFKGPLEDLELACWNRIISTNLTGCFLCAKHTVKHIRPTKGAIVNIASTRALQSEPRTEAYSASKGGIVALTHALAISLGPDIRVNCISPGWIDVSEWQKASRRKTRELRTIDHAQHPVGRVGSAEDIANLAAYLISDEAGFITGQNFIVDGGMTRKMIYED